MKVTLKGGYDGNKSSATATLALRESELLLNASMTNATLLSGGPSLDGLELFLQKPDRFHIGFNFPKKDVKFRFMDTVQVLKKPVSLKYTHARGDNSTEVDGTVAFDPANKMNVSYAFGSGPCKVRYTYVHGKLRRTLFEPCYDVTKNAWDFAVTRKFEPGGSVKATYETSSRKLAFECDSGSQISESFKLKFGHNGHNLHEVEVELTLQGSGDSVAWINVAQ